MKRIATLSAMVALAVLVSAPAQADVLLGWNFDGGANDASVAPTTTAMGVVANPAVKEDGLGAKSGMAGDINWTGWANYGAASFADALTANDYVSFVIEPQAGQEITLTSFSMSGRQREDGTVTDPVQSTDIALFDAGGAQIGGTIAVSSNVYGVYSIDLSSMAAITSATQLRLAFVATPTTNFRGFFVGSEDVGINDLAFEGTVVPEPATLSVLALGALGLIRRRRA